MITDFDNIYLRRALMIVFAVPYAAAFLIAGALEGMSEAWGDYTADFSDAWSDRKVLRF